MHLPDPHVARPPERRRRARPSCHHAAMIRLGEQGPDIPCIVTNMDFAGARLTLSAQRPLPTDVRLVLIRSAVAFDATIRWRRGLACGLTFLARHDLVA
ncbi:MAG: hypothetical protein HY859_02880 [Caulobacterales bacterium]|nr:hypothetical protein [Caulobacterales bacterium]